MTGVALSSLKLFFSKKTWRIMNKLILALIHHLCAGAQPDFLALRSYNIGLGEHRTLQGLPQVSQRRLRRSEPSPCPASGPVSVPAAAAAWRRRPDDDLGGQLQRSGQIRRGATAGQRLLWHRWETCVFWDTRMLQFTFYFIYLTKLWVFFFFFFCRLVLI